MIWAEAAEPIAKAHTAARSLSFISVVPHQNTKQRLSLAAVRVVRLNTSACRTCGGHDGRAVLEFAHLTDLSGVKNSAVHLKGQLDAVNQGILRRAALDPAAPKAAPAIAPIAVPLSL